MSGNDKVPIMPVWVSDFFGSSRVQSMSGFAQGIYCLLLMHEWQLELKSDFLKSDSRFLVRLLKITSRQWKMVAPQVLPMFREENGILYNPRLRQVLLDTKRRIKKVRDRGKKAAEARWK